MRIRLNRRVPGLALACASLLALPWASYGRLTNAPAGQIGHLEQAKTITGADLKSAQNQPLGKINDVVVDLESGRILYTIATLNGVTGPVAIPPEVISGGAAMAAPKTGLGAVIGRPAGRTHILNVDQTKLSTAPKVTAAQQSNPGDVAFLTQVYQFYGVPAWWQGAAEQAQGSFNNVQKVSALVNHPVKDVANADFGKFDDAVLDLQAGRVPFVLLVRNGQEYAIPPNAFTLSADKQNLVTGLDQNTLNSAPRFAKGNLQTLANTATATSIYQHYGKQPYFAQTAVPVGTNPSGGVGTPSTSVTGGLTNSPTNAVTRPWMGQHDRGVKGFIGQFEEGRKLINAQIMNAQNQPIGTIQDAVVDLESGRVLFTIASINGSNDRIALPPESFTVQGTPQQGGVSTHILNVDQAKLNGAPKFTAAQESQLNNAAFVSQVYQYFGTAPWWEGGAQAQGSFNAATKLSGLFDHAVKDVSNADLGKIDDVIVDLQGARLPFLILLSQQNADYAVPPMAFTLSADKQTLTTGLDQNTLASAPRFTKGNLRMLANRAMATSIYRHYGKQPYFGEGLSPTSERTNVPPYVYPNR